MTDSLFGINGSPTELTVTAGYKSQTFIATAGQTLFSGLTNAYTPGTTTLAVFIDGSFITDFTETSPTSFTLTTPAFALQEIIAVTSLPLNTAIPLSLIGGSTGPAVHYDYDPISTGSWLFQRIAAYDDGTLGWVNAGLRVDVYTQPNNKSDEWAGVFVMHNHSNFGENVGLYAQGIKYGQGPTWGATIEVIDRQSIGDPTSGVVGLEVDVNGNGTDVNKARVGIDIALRRPPDNPLAFPAHFAYGLRIQNSFDTQVTCDTGIGFYPGMTFGIGQDFSGAIILGPTINLNTAQAINLNGNAGVAALTRQLFYSGGGYHFANSVGNNYWIFNDNGSLLANGTQLLGAQQTVTGSRGGNAALASLITKCAAHGFLIDATTP